MKVIKMNDSDKRFVFTGKILSYLLPILSFTIVPLIFYEPNLSLLGSYLAFPMFFAPIFYAKYHKKFMISNIETDRIYREDRYLFLLLLILYSLFFSISIGLLVIYDIRPFAYYATIALIATFVLFEILLLDISYKKSVIILVQIMMLSLNTIWGVTLKYYHFIERTDPLVHTWYITNLLSQGYVTDIFSLYQKFPLWHIMVASSYVIIDISVPIYKMMYFINGLNFAFMILIIYFISLKIFKDKKIGLMSALFMALNPYINFYGMSSIPRSVVSFFEVIIILLLIDRNDSRKMFLAIILTFVIIMYHTASTPFIIFILLVIYILQKLYDVKYESRFITKDYIILATIATLAYWIYCADNVFEIIVRNIFKPPVTGIITKSIVYAPSNELFNYLQFFPLLIFVIIGTMWISESNRFSGLEKIFGMTGLLLIAVTFPGPALLLNKFAENFNLERFGLYSLTLIIIVGATGFIWMYHVIGKKLKIIAIILFVIMSFLSISNDFNASDNPLVKRIFYTFYLNEEETVAFDHIADITNGYVLSDYVAKRYLSSSQYKSKSHFLEVDPINMAFIRNNNNDVILIRYQELNKRPLRFFTSKNAKFKLNPNEKGSTDYYYQDSPLWNSLKRYDKIYDSGGINGFN